MQTTETLLGLLRERGKRGLPLKRVYRQLYNLHLYLTAYGRIYRNAGAMTPGVTQETVDAMSLGRKGRSAYPSGATNSWLRSFGRSWTPILRGHLATMRMAFDQNEDATRRFEKSTPPGKDRHASSRATSPIALEA